MTRLNVRDFGTALSFDGANYLTIDAVATDVFNSTLLDEFTLSIWAKTNVSGQQTMIGFGNFSEAYSYVILDIGGTTAGRARFSIRNNAAGTDSASAAASKTTNDSRWHHYVGIKTANQILLYIDGNLIQTVSSLQGGTYLLTQCEIGALNRISRVLFFTGGLDEPRIWNRALTASEVSDLYYNGLTRGSALATGLVGEWLFNEGSGSTAYDTSGNGNHGTITGATYTTDVPMVARGSVPTGGDPALMRKFVNGNLIKNGDFKYTPPFTAATTGTARFIDGTAAGSLTNGTFGWALQLSATNAGTSGQYDSSVLYNEKPTLKLSCSSTNVEASCVPANTSAYLPLYAPRIPTPGVQYKLSGYIKTEYTSGSAGGVYLEAVRRTISGGAAGTSTTTAIHGTSDWTYYEVTFTPEAGSVYLVPRLRLQGNSGSANLVMTAWFADIQLKPTTPETRQTA